ncbi:N-acetylmuramoyl-L-alanine amidase [Nocardioides sp. HM23]|uniref:N-acetylmuramoyl-L-alanine amidase n=1 Tax=Nocardioides bizhenqiangii TaxID=3095076 RepID=UPI002ACA5F7B|nr:N-acetylmuramoyl-L-alanine amidase [Nocardioides sp. HM23]MDZ5621215.1 N-acetylmuramoyl-L-alanine amidase [Nocardioides sp. HM23]
MLASPTPSPEGAVDHDGRVLRVRTARRNRFVSACQQLLALGLVLAALTPAARTVTMDVRPAAPADARTQGGAALRSAPATVPTTAVDPDVTEYSLTAPPGARLAPGALRASSRRTATGGQQLTSDAVPVLGYGAVGVTWQHGQQVADDALAVEARTFQDGAWSDWTDVPYHDDHGPDPDSDEARHARPGTEPLLVGEVDQVQVRVATDSSAPADMKLAVVDPGEATTTARQTPEIDTDTLDGDPAGTSETSEGELALRAKVAAPKPKIFSRAQWGADESMRDKPSLHYYEVHAGFVHHTVNANAYTRDQVPSIIRGIYAYHTRSQGWSDIGYNFLVDRFGRIWEGRFGGVGRPVVGAHTLGYNDNAFAMSAIGNFETARPSRAMVRAYGRLFAWKLALHGVDAADRRQHVTSDYFKAINGHRDAGSTACPGIHLYNRIPRIRELASTVQEGWDGRELESSLVGSARPDLVLRRAVDGKVFLRQVVPTDAGYRLGKRVPTGLLLPEADRIIKAGDWDLDGYGDLIVKDSGVLWLYRGVGRGKFAPEPRRLALGFGQVTKLAAVGDFTGDGRPDLMGQPDGGSMRIYPGAGASGLRRSYTAYSPVPGRKQVPIGRWDRDGAPDSLIRTRSGLVLYYGNGPGGFTRQKSMALPVRGYDWLIGVDDVDLIGHSDLIARTRSTGQLWVIPGSADGFRAPVAITGDTQGYDLAG